MKKFWRDNEHFADLFNAYFFNGEKVIKPEELQEADTDVSGTLNKKSLTNDYQKALDVVKKSAYGMDFVILGLENQQKIHYAMPLRIMQGDVMLYMKEYNEIQKEHKKNPDETSGEFLSKFKKTDRLHPVITICVYYGEEEWDGPRCLADMLKIPDKMETLVSDYKMNLLEIKKSESLNFNDLQVRAVFEITRSIYQRDFSKINEKYSNVELDPEVGLLVGSITNTQSLVNQALLAKKEGGRFNMCTAMKEFELESTKKGVNDFAEMLQWLRRAGRRSDAEKAIDDPKYRDKMFEEYYKIK